MIDNTLALSQLQDAMFNVISPPSAFSHIIPHFSLFSIAITQIGNFQHKSAIFIIKKDWHIHIGIYQSHNVLMLFCPPHMYLLRIIKTSVAVAGTA